MNKIVAADKSVSIFHFGQPCLCLVVPPFYAFYLLVSERIAVIVVSLSLSLIFIAWSSIRKSEFLRIHSISVVFAWIIKICITIDQHVRTLLCGTFQASVVRILKPKCEPGTKWEEKSKSKEKRHKIFGGIFNNTLLCKLHMEKRKNEKG